jgi:hypothetical protein
MQKVSPNRMLERRFLKRFAWLFPLLGIPLGCLLAGGLWAWIADDPSLRPESWTGYIATKGIALGLCISLYPVVWWMGLKLEAKVWGIWRLWPVIPALAVCVVVAAEWGLRQTVAQELFWQAVRVRAGDNYFTREVALLRMDHARAAAQNSLRPGIVVCGSSQILHALDIPLLQELTGRPVYRRSTAGMFVMEALAARGWLEYPGDHVFLTMRSGFDLYARDRLDPRSIKPVATLSGIRDLYGEMEWSLRVREWRAWVDLWASVACDLWRSREYVRLLWQQPLPRVTAPRPVGGVEQVKPNGDIIEKDINVPREAPGSETGRYLPFKSRVTHRTLQRLIDHYSTTIIIEGQVNPDFLTPGLMRLNETYRSIMATHQGNERIWWVPVEEQPIHIEAEHWLDNTHVTAEGRAIYTRYIAEMIRDIQKRNARCSL